MILWLCYACCIRLVNLWCLTPILTIFPLYRGSQVLLMEETGVPGENQQPAASHWQTLSHNVVSSTPSHGART